MFKFKMTKIEDWNDIGEENQPVPIKFAFGKLEDNIYTNTMPFVKCRDFLSDVLYVYLNKKELPKIYGFQATPDMIQDSILLLSDVDVDFDAQKTKLLWEMEDRYGISRTKVVELTKKYTALHFDPVYLSNSFILSYYTSYIRLLTYSNMDTFSAILKVVTNSTGNDANFFIDSNNRKKYENLDLKKLMKPCTYGLTLKESVSNIHNCSGIYTYIKYPNYIKPELL